MKKNNIFLMGLVALFLLIILSTTASSTHPFLLFSNYSDTPSAKYSTGQWATWKAWVHSDRLSSEFWDAGGYDYYIYGTTDGLNHTISTLNNFSRTAGDGRDIARVNELWRICLAYDLVQPFLNSSEDSAAREKIGELADQVYYDINHDGSGYSNTIQCVDYDFKAYPALGVAGILMENYTNYSLPHGSNASAWLTAATEDFFVLDTTHTISGWSGSVFSYCINPQGLDLVAGDYRSYYADELLGFAQIYSKNKENLVTKYPALRNWIMAPVYYYMPNKYDTNRGSAGQAKMVDGQWWINLLNSTDRQYLIKHYSDTIADTTLPYSRSFAYVSDETPSEAVALSSIDNYENVTRATPHETTILSDLDYQVFRKDWSNTSYWFNFVTWNSNGTENRFMAHDDILSFDLYDKGDYVLADSGEIKYVRPGYGPVFAKGHNILMFNDTNNGNMTSFYKGGVYFADYPTTITTLNSELMSFVEGKISSNSIETTNSTGARTSSETAASTLTHTRAVLDAKEYFVVIDSFPNSINREFDLLLQLSSFNHTPTNSSTQIGGVAGNLTINGTQVPWTTYSFEDEVNIRNASDIKWNTMSVYGDALQTHIYSMPSAEASVEKYWFRVGGHEGYGPYWGGVNEVYHPLLRLKNKTSSDYRRLTLIYTRNISAESNYTIRELSSRYDSLALEIVNGTKTTMAYAGNGSNAFGIYKTNANYSWASNESNAWAGFMRQGSYLNATNAMSLVSNATMDYVLWNSSGNKTSVVYACNGGIRSINLRVGSCVNPNVMIGGVTVNSSCLDSTHVIFNASCAEQTAEYMETGTGGTTTTTSTIATTTTTITTTTSTTTTTLLCELSGNYPPCETVTLREVIDYISVWIRDEATLAEVIRLINAWVGSG